jgi:pyrimidine-nucleoside phosphorylase
MLDAVGLIHKKRDGGELSPSEIGALISGYISGEVADYQMAAFCMAVFYTGMTPAETGALTTAMAKSGETVDLGGIVGRKVDKHSTGGVADTTTLVLGPLVAACGAPVAKMSGRGLGHTGGTIDKLESIPGFRVALNPAEFFSVVNRVGLAVIGQTQNIAPADKLLYALRDVTATVDSIPLIASSIMSKKIAGGADAIVLDVKCGSGAFMKTPERARELAAAMVAIGREVGRDTVAVISDMNQPLGLAIGNSLEVAEAVQTLKGYGPPRLLEVCLTLGSEMLVLAGRAGDVDEARRLLGTALQDGAGLAKFAEWVAAQGGDPRVVEDPALLGTAPVVSDYVSTRSGYLARMDSEVVGRAAMALGAGRRRKEDVIDLSVGLVMGKCLGDPVAAGEPLCRIHARRPEDVALVSGMLDAALTIEDGRPADLPLVYDVIR